LIRFFDRLIEFGEVLMIEGFEDRKAFFSATCMNCGADWDLNYKLYSYTKREKL
jgi:hypothetical protein